MFFILLAKGAGQIRVREWMHGRRMGKTKYDE
jgi:hypothetical protein